MGSEFIRFRGTLIRRLGENFVEQTARCVDSFGLAQVNALFIGTSTDANNHMTTFSGVFVPY